MISQITDLNQLIQALVYGDTVLLLDGAPEALCINSKGWPNRAITEPEGEKVLRGPREGFTESLLMNLSMVRRKLKTHELKFKFKNLGSRSHTKACICNIEGLAGEAILSELEKRLDEINLDGVLDTGKHSLPPHFGNFFRLSRHIWLYFGHGRTINPPVPNTFLWSALYDSVEFDQLSRLKRYRRQSPMVVYEVPA